MDITNFTKQQGLFLKAEHINGETKAVIISEAQIVHNDKFNTDRLHIPVQLTETDYVFDASKTNARTISEVLGKDTSKWIGQTLILEIYKTKTSDGKMIDAINVKEIVKNTEKTLP